MRPAMLIAGGTGSIGGAIAGHALAAGWRVVIGGRGEGSVETARDRIGGGDDLHGVAADVFAAGGVEMLVEQAVASAGRIDAVIDCVTGGAPGITGAFGGTDPQAYPALYDASIVHLQRLAHAALPHLIASGGTLVAFASDAGRFAAPGQTMIGASRAAIMAFVRNLAMEVARDGVRAHCVSPSYVEGSESLKRTEARVPGRLDTARRRAGLGLPTPDDIAPLVVFLCGEGARKMTGQVISINGGLNA